MNSQRKKDPGIGPTTQRPIHTLGVEVEEQIGSGRPCADFDRVSVPLSTLVFSPLHRIDAALIIAQRRGTGRAVPCHSNDTHVDEDLRWN